MDETWSTTRLSRRRLLKAGGLGALALAGARTLPLVSNRSARAMVAPIDTVSAPVTPVNIHLAGTDGYILLPGRGSPLLPGQDPVDDAVGNPLYVFGFVRVPVGTTPNQLDVFKGGVQVPAPIIGVDQEADVYLTLTNLGFSVRPDLDDSHTIHWHGFPNATSIFDGVPEVSIAVPAGRDFPYYYKPHRVGTFMYHCHFEDVEHVQMGMLGSVFVRPGQNGSSFGGFTKFAYNDEDGTTGFDREFALMFDELWTTPHDNSESIQETVWPNYKADYWIINGRSYPDTLKPNNDPALPANPLSSLIQVNEGDRVLLRFASLGYEQQSMQLPGIPMTVVGEDASLLRNGTVDLSYSTNTIYFGPGEARDVLFMAPDFSGVGDYDVYWLRNREPHKLTNRGLSFGGQVTQIWVYPEGTLADQSHPNETYPEFDPPAELEPPGSPPYQDPWIV